MIPTLSRFYPLGSRNYAICIVGIINNTEKILDTYFSVTGGHFNAMTGGKINSTELVAALINQKSSLPRDKVCSGHR